MSHDRQVEGRGSATKKLLYKNKKKAHRKTYQIRVERIQTYDGHENAEASLPYHINTPVTGSTYACCDNQTRLQKGGGP